MATFVNSNQDVYFNGYHVESWDTRAELRTGCEGQDNTTLADTTRKYTGGLLTNELEIDGYEDYAANAHDVLFNPVSGTYSNVNITLCPQGGTQGNPSYSGTYINADYSKQMSLGEMAKFQIKAKNSGSIFFKGSIMETDKSVTAGGTGTYRQLGALLATQTLASALHVTSAGSGLIVYVKSAATSGGTYTTRLTHTSSSAIGSEIKTLTGTAVTDTYWRVDWALTSGTAVFTVCVGIK